MIQVGQGDAYSILGELGYIVTLQQEGVVLGVFLWDGECFVGLPLLVEVGEEDACVIAVYASAAEGYPSSVAAPAVETLRVWAVCLIQVVAVVCLQVFYP